MPESTLRDLCTVISPPWLRRVNGGSLMQALSLPLDALVERTRQGVRAHLPGAGAPGALGYIGNDRQIERGPTQSDSGYAVQLSSAFDTWRNAGGARTVLSQLRFYFAPGDGPDMQTVSDRATHHVMDPVTGIVTKTATAGDWNWDNALKKWRFWCIIDVTGLFDMKIWGDGQDYGSNNVWGVDMPLSTVLDLKRIVKKWMRASNLAQIILMFDSAAMPNPSGNGEDPAFRLTIPAVFFAPMWWT